MKRIALALLLASTPAAAQTVFPTPNPAYQATGEVQMCLNASGQAVAISSGNCANGAAPGATVTPSSAASAGNVPAVTRGATALQAKASAGNLYGFTLTEGATAGFFAVIDAAAVPAAGATIAPNECISVPANGGYRTRQDVPDRYLNGVVIVSTSSCATYTAVTPQVIEAVVQ